MQIYDFDELQQRFPTMTFTEILQEYAKVKNAIKEADEFQNNFYKYIDPLDEAENFLEFYIAKTCCEEHGIEVYS